MSTTLDSAAPTPVFSRRQADDDGALTLLSQGRIAQVALERATAAEVSDELWQAYDEGLIKLFVTSHMTAQAVAVRPSIVAEAVYAWFEEAWPARLAEVIAAIEGGMLAGPLTCSDGGVVRDDLFQMVYSDVAW